MSPRPQAPPVPPLRTELRSAARGETLARIVTSDAHHRTSRRLVAGGACAALAIGAVTAAIVLILAGTHASTAFARWQPKPTAPMLDQVSNAISTCEQENPAVGTAPPTVADTRGPYSMLVWDANGSNVMCIADSQGGLFSGQTGPIASNTLAATAIEPEASGIGAARDTDQMVSFADGKVGAGVIGVALDLGDGTAVQATLQNGWFGAWWPGSQPVSAAEITTSSGTTTETLHVGGPPPSLPGAKPGQS